MIVDDVVQRGAQFFASLAYGVIIIAVRDLCLCDDACESEKQDECGFFHELAVYRHKGRKKAERSPLFKLEIKVGVFCLD